jgi:hypothetical protein
MVQGPWGLFSKAAYAYRILWNGSVTLKFIPGQPHKDLFIVMAAVPACPVVVYLREWGAFDYLSRVCDATFEKRPPQPCHLLMVPSKL